MTYYYCHHESGCIWMSESADEAEGLVEQIDEHMFNNLDAMGYTHHHAITTKSYAGIGARKAPKYVLDIMEKTAILLGNDGYTCNTGAADGADKAFAMGAFKRSTPLSLFLPWPAYETVWVNSVSAPTTKVTSLGSHKLSDKAHASVYQFHPRAAVLSNAVIKLHARNYLIIHGTNFVVCWTPYGEVTGGTGQGIRIAQSMNIPIYNLGDDETLNAFDVKIQERSNKL